MANKSLCSTQRRLNLVLISAALLLSQTVAFSSTTSRRISPTTTTSLHAFFSSRLTDSQLQTYKGHRYSSPSSRNGTTDTSFWSPTEEQSSRLKVRRRVQSVVRRVRSSSSSTSSSRLEAVPEKTWSRPADETSSSTGGVRNRVKEVLKKAKKRTGVNNNSDDQFDRNTNAGLWIADAASIGGLSGSTAELVIKKKRNGVNGSSTKKNGNSMPKVNGKSGVNGVNGSTKTPPRVEDLVVKGKNNTVGTARVPELDVLRSDVPSVLPEPLPFSLPTLSEEQKKMLVNGERVQEQSKMGREGSGYVVVDVKAPPYIVWECLLDFEEYPKLIKTVRSMEMFTSNKLRSGYHAEKPVPPSENKALRHYGIPSVTRAAFVLSKFKLNIAAIHNYRPHPDGHYMVFNLDPECTNIVLKSATGIWHVQNNPDGRGEDISRVWLLCDLKVSKLLPQFIVDYTAKRAMPRATNWLKPYVEPIAEQWLKLEEAQKRRQKQKMP